MEEHLALEDMAAQLELPITEPDDQTLRRWKTLFSLDDPYTAIIEHRNSLGLRHVSQSHWDLVKEQKEAEGHDRETYEYSLTLKPQRLSDKATTEKIDNKDSGTYLLQLNTACAPLASAKAVQRLAGLDATPQVVRDDMKAAVFIQVSEIEKTAIETALANEYPHTRPLFIRVAMPAQKALHHYSKYPMLGIESTLPQHRLESLRYSRYVLNHQIPVWYFFYGTLAQPHTLRCVLGLDESEAVSYRKARVHNANLTTWGGKYNALVDGNGSVQGSAYLVQSAIEEDRLRAYETSQYEVVRCTIDLVNGPPLQGLTFRYITSQSFQLDFFG